MARLVKGSTDLLQPINLLPNSDFSRSDGHPATQTFSTFAPNSVYITANHKLQFYDGNFNNLNVTVGKNSIKITGNTTVSSSRIYLYYTDPNERTLVDVKEYTVGWTYDLAGSTGSILANSGGSNTGIGYFYKTYENSDGSYNHIECNIKSQEIGDSFLASFICPKFTIQYIGYFSIEIKNLYLYRGLLTNPPKWSPSLDVCYSNQFMLKDLSNLQTKQSYVNFTIPANDTTYYQLQDTGGNIFHKTFIKVRGSLFEIGFSYYVPYHSKGVLGYSKCLINDNIQSILPSFYLVNQGGGIRLAIKLQNNTSSINVSVLHNVSYTANVNIFYNSGYFDSFGNSLASATLVKSIPIEYPE